MDSSYAHRVERSKKLTLEERFNDTLEMIDLSRELMKAGIRMQFPDADEVKVLAILRQRLQIIQAVENRR